MVEIDLTKANLEGSLKIVEGFLGESLENEEKKFKVKLIFEEIITNMFKHGKKQGTTFVKVDFQLEGEDVILTFVYNGEQFDPTLYRDKRVDEPFNVNKKEGGLGLFLVKQFSKEFTYEREGDLNRLNVKV